MRNVLQFEQVPKISLRVVVLANATDIFMTEDVSMLYLISQQVMNAGNSIMTVLLEITVS